MKAIHLVAVGAAGLGRPVRSGGDDGMRNSLLVELDAALASVFRVSCHIRPEVIDAGFAYDPARNQYHSTAILQTLAAAPRDADGRLLGITALDLYVPVLTFVFGEAQLNGACALVSFHRLREEFYGLPTNESLLHERLLKESVHELGHTFGLRHCDNWQCVMASTHAVERLDTKGADFCPACRSVIDAEAPALRTG